MSATLSANAGDQPRLHGHLAYQLSQARSASPFVSTHSRTTSLPKEVSQVTSSLRYERRYHLGCTFGALERKLTESLLRLDEEGARAQVRELHENVGNSNNVKWRIRRACKRALMKNDERLRRGQQDARHVLNLVRQLMEPRMFDELLVRLDMQHLPLS